MTCQHRSRLARTSSLAAHTKQLWSLSHTTEAYSNIYNFTSHTNHLPQHNDWVSLSRRLFEVAAYVISHPASSSTVTFCRARSRGGLDIQGRCPSLNGGLRGGWSMPKRGISHFPLLYRPFTSRTHLLNHRFKSHKSASRPE